MPHAHWLAAPLVLGLAVCNASARTEARTDDAMIEPYLGIAAALADDRIDGVAALAKQLDGAAKAFDDKPGVTRIRAAVAGVGASDIAAARRAFKSMSDGMIEYMRSEPATQAGRLLVHCTMAFDNKGAMWVQKDDKIANPYYGAAMLRCGNKLSWVGKLPNTAKLE